MTPNDMQAIRERVLLGYPGEHVYSSGQAENDAEILLAYIDAQAAETQSQLEACKKELEHLSAGKFWNELYDKGLTSDDIKNELADFHFIMKQVPKVYMHITGGKLSKAMYCAGVVISEADEYQNKLINEAVANETEELNLEIDKLKAQNLALEMALAEAKEAMNIADELADTYRQLNMQYLEDNRRLKSAHGSMKAEAEAMWQVVDGCNENFRRINNVEPLDLNLIWTPLKALQSLEGV